MPSNEEFGRAPLRRSEDLAAPGGGESHSCDTPPVPPDGAEYLNRVAKEYPWTLFGVRELATMIRVSAHLITAAAKHPRGPFKGKSKKSRPELVTQFLMNPPEDFVIDYGNAE